MADADTINEFLACRNYAVVGVSPDHAKYGHVIWRDLQTKGYIVYPVNPKYDEIEGETCYRSLADVPGVIDVVDVVVPPPVTEKVVRQCAELGLTRVWLQPGAESDAAIEFCRQNGITVLSGICVMVQSRRP
jgi:predicted CoA-binding protein